MPELPLVSVLFITYNRLVTLRPTVESFLANTDYPRERLELIVCDDCSPPAVQDEIRRMPFDVFCFARRRGGGLGGNVNQGLRAATGEFILQLQDDWECCGPRDYLSRAVAALEAVPDVGMVILNPHPNELPVRQTLALPVGSLRVFENRPGAIVKAVGEAAYTDWPHLKRRAFHDRIGLYRENAPMWECELDFSRRVNGQGESCIADMPELTSFRHIGAEVSYNWPWKKRVESWVRAVPAGAALMQTYRALRSFTRS